MFRLPKIATAPFCPSEVNGSIDIPQNIPTLKKFFKVAGPGLLISIGYMDPGNWATDIEAGSKYGYALLSIILMSSLIAMILQTLSLRLGLVARKDLAQACSERYSKKVNLSLWLLAELAIIACDLAEVLGSALALHLLFDIPIMWGVVITAFDMLIVLGLKGRGFRQVEAIVLGLIATIAVCFIGQLILLGPDPIAILHGFIPQASIFQNSESLFLAIGILGATVMPHNLYLHSSIVQTRHLPTKDTRALKEIIKLSTWDTMTSLSIALLINAAILIVAATAFNSSGHTQVSDIQDAYHLLDPIVGGTAASLLFGIALLASGQSSTFTGTIAGQVIMEGFLKLKIPCWQRRIITRIIALVPAIIGLAYLGDKGIGALLIASQVVLSLQLPFAIWPLIRLTNDKNIMGEFANSWRSKIIVWALLIIISVANILLLFSLLS